jgi:hypothetical protein
VPESDFVSPSRNGFYDFSSLSMIFAEVAVELMKIETVVNAPLDCP